MRNVALPTSVFFRNSTQRCASDMVSTTMWSRPGHAVLTATSYFSLVAPRSPSLPCTPFSLPADWAAIRAFTTWLCVLSAFKAAFFSSTLPLLTCILELRSLYWPSRSWDSFITEANSAFLVFSVLCIDSISSPLRFTVCKASLMEASVSESLWLAPSTLSSISFSSAAATSISPCTSFFCFSQGASSKCTFSSFVLYSAISPLNESCILSSLSFSYFSLFWEDSMLRLSSGISSLNASSSDSSLTLFFFSLWTLSSSFLSFCLTCFKSSRSLMSFLSNFFKSPFTLLSSLWTTSCSLLFSSHSFSDCLPCSESSDFFPRSSSIFCCRAAFSSSICLIVSSELRTSKW
mmetsp:Transcript_2851/g.6916  ORF Transcript_2851/g.6916 Transcript_2851/m.6916 type:complete len:348 (+) Transcript_2851:2711-3754(+)